jgi:monomeric phenylalanine-4-hydroxylase
LRLTNTFGPRQLLKHARQGFIPWFIRLALEGKEISVFGDGLQTRDVTYADDALDALLRVGALAELDGQAFNVGASEVHSVRAIAEQIIRTAGQGSLTIVPFPEEKLRIDVGSVACDFSALRAATGWEIVAVPGLIPDDAFFTHLANRRFPVTVWLRQPAEFDYIVEPDVFHDFFGHVPLLFDRVYADHLYEYGKGGLKAMRLDAVKMLARLYWFTIEFGLMRTAHGVRAYGAGLLSSGGELAYCIDHPQPRRLPFELERIMRTEYQIDRYQETYFVIDSFEQLMRETAPDFTPLYERIRKQPTL